ncbi:tRNA methyltransferase complex subunit Cpd1 [Cladochytrium replicatum]|nr:tRNA methyltransferase complex subunit Cpd1 [Cladochytrium replicatum]
MALFAKYSMTISEGDFVVIFVTPENKTIIQLTADGTYTNRAGKFPHSEIIGKPWGSKIFSTNKKGYVHLLYPTPEMWTDCLPHRTQILYTTDISYVSCLLDLKPGVKMIESGTGSGSFSHSLARTIAPTGHLYTFEYHEPRATQAKKEFESHGLSQFITVECKDVCKDGFGIENLVTAVFLDLPAPWEAIPSAKKAFNKNRVGRICCFSPCIEQVLETVKELKTQNFTDIRMFECLSRPQYTQTHEFPPVPLQPKAKKWAGEKSEKGITDLKRKGRDDNGAGDHQDGDNGEEPRSKRKKTDDKPEDDVVKGQRENVQALDSVGIIGSSIIPVPGDGKIFIGKTQAKVRGHTSYLTFATLLPVDPLESAESQ